MEKLENRNNVRLNNQLSVLSLLRKGKRTITDLADHLEVSFSATRHIVDELVEGGLCHYSSKQAINSRGRVPVFVELNNKSGVLCAVDFSSNNLKVIIAAVDGHILTFKEIKDVHFIKKEHFIQTEAIIRELLKEEEIKGRPLLSICICTPGIVDRTTFEYVSAYRVKEADKINPVSYFSNAFNVNVEMYNDVRIGSLAELKYGALPSKSINSMFVHIGAASGCSIINNGKIYVGAHGYAGETPSYSEDDELTRKSLMNNRFFSIWEMKRYIEKKKGDNTNANQNINIDELVANYLNNDPIYVEAVDVCCKYNAITIIGLATMLDLDYVVIEGPILKFGETIISNISKYISQFSLNSVRARILPSKLGSDTTIIGTIYQAQSIYFYKKLEEINRKRLNMNDFVINPAFKEI